MKIPTTDLCAQAGVTMRSYAYAAAGRVTPSPATIAKLNTALNRFRLGFGAEAGELAPHAAYKLCLIVAAGYLKQQPKAALAADPGRRATSDEAWMAAANVRRLALWIATGQCGFRTSDMARAAGLTKQAVSAAVRDIEDEADLDGVRAEIEELFA